MFCFAGGREGVASQDPNQLQEAGQYISVLPCTDLITNHLLFLASTLLGECLQHAGLVFVHFVVGVMFGFLDGCLFAFVAVVVFCKMMVWMDGCMIENLGQVATKKKGRGGKDAMLCFFGGVFNGREKRCIFLLVTRYR
jgi:hypothetical protein